MPAAQARRSETVCCMRIDIVVRGAQWLNAGTRLGVVSVWFCRSMLPRFRALRPLVVVAGTASPPNVHPSCAGGLCLQQEAGACRAGLSEFYTFFSSICRIISCIDSDGSPRTMRWSVMWKLALLQIEVGAQSTGQDRPEDADAALVDEHHQVLGVDGVGDDLPRRCAGAACGRSVRRACRPRCRSA